MINAIKVYRGDDLAPIAMGEEILDRRRDRDRDRRRKRGEGKEGGRGRG